MYPELLALQILAYSGYVVICLLKQLDCTEHVRHFWLIFCWGFNHSMVCFLPCEILVAAFCSWWVEFSLPLVWWCWERWPSTSRTAGSFLSPSHPGSPSTLGLGFAAHGFAIARPPKLQGNGDVSLWVRTSLYLAYSHLTLQQRGVWVMISFCPPCSKNPWLFTNACGPAVTEVLSPSQLPFSFSLPFPSLSVSLLLLLYLPHSWPSLFLPWPSLSPCLS